MKFDDIIKRVLNESSPDPLQDESEYGVEPQDGPKALDQSDAEIAQHLSKAFGLLSGSAITNSLQEVDIEGIIKNSGLGGPTDWGDSYQKVHDALAFVLKEIALWE